MVIKKTKRRNKNKRKTKRKQTGGKVYEVTRYSNNNNVLLFNILQELPNWKSKNYIKTVFMDKQFKIVPYLSNFSMDDFLPELNGQEADLINIFTGNPLTDPKLKKSTIYSHSTQDDQFFKLNALFLKEIEKEGDFRKAVIRVLTQKDLYKKILCLRILVYIYLGKNGIPVDHADINENIKDIPSINDEATFKDDLSVDIIPQQENGKTYYQKDFDIIKSAFKLNNINQISTNIYSNGLLTKCYEDIADTDIVSIMNTLTPGDREKYNLIYSENNRRTYDNIRYILLNTSIISKDLTGMVDMEALITPAEREKAKADEKTRLEEKAKADEKAKLEEIARREEIIRNTSLIAVLAANERNRPRAPLAVGPGAPLAPRAPLAPGAPLGPGALLAPGAPPAAIIAAIAAANRPVIADARRLVRAAAAPDANNAIIAAVLANERNGQGPFNRAAAVPNAAVPVVAAAAAMGNQNAALLPAVIAAGIPQNP